MKVDKKKVQKWFAGDGFELVAELLRANEFAAAERARVDAYVRPIFDRYGFADDEGRRIADPRSIYRCNDDEACGRYFAECDKVHREHGFTGPEGHCPALIAENDALKAQRAAIKSILPALGLDADAPVYGRLRDRLVELMIEGHRLECKKRDAIWSLLTGRA